MSHGIERGPTRTGVVLSMAATGVSILALAAGGVPAGLGIGAVGGAMLVTGALAGSRRLLDYAALVVFGAVLFSGVGGAHPGPMLVSLVALVVAWDAAEQAINVGEQLGREARTRRAETVHVAATTMVGLGGSAVGYGAYRLAGAGQPASAVVVLLLGTVLIVWALRG